MNEDLIIDKIIHSFSMYNLRDIKEINNNELDFTIAEFILCSCFIDQISGFRYCIREVGKRYKQFVQDYLPMYNPEELYYDLRNKLVHNYSIGKYYGLTRRAPHFHLQIEDGITHLNLENFIIDLYTALNTYIFELKNDIDIKNNAINWYTQHNIISLRP